MNISYGSGKTEFGPGVSIELSGDEVTVAISKYLITAHDIHVHGARTITVNGEHE